MHPDNLIIEYLKAMRAELADVKSGISDLRQRMVSLDGSAIDLRRSYLHLHEDNARQQLALEKLSERVQRIERRLELV
jgi:chromosome segregation ATPase